MGVRGLTKYIATKAEKYLDPHELHDCDLVIDGDNLASQLFRKSDAGLSAFGGNYDIYFREVVAFFNLLKKCNVRAFVLMDGGYEHKKMRTTKERLLGRIGVIKTIIPLDSRNMAIPLLMRECFIDAVKSCNVKFMRCFFEADNEIAILAKKLKCPVLSYDSDFYIFDGLYIPYVTVTHQIHKKTIISKNSYEVEILRKRPKGQKNWKKATKKFLVEDHETDQANHKLASAPEETKTYNYLDCCIYTVENLTEGQLDKEMLPLFATLIGNDFIHKNVFNNFLRNVKRKFNKKYSPQQKRILKIMDFLKNETLKSAITKIMGHMKRHQRANLLERIKYAMSGYCIEKSEAFDYFGLEKEFPHIENNDEYEFDLDGLLASTDEEESDEENVDQDENDEEDEEEDEEEETEEEDESDDNISDEENEEVSEEQKENSEEDIKDRNPDSGSETESLDRGDSPFSRKKFVFPEWFEKRYKAGTVPRFVCDIFRFRRYINYPQVEEFDRPDSNQIAYTLLKIIFGLLNKSKTDHMLYYTRIPRKLRFDVQIFENNDAIEDFDPTEKKNVKYLKMAFSKNVKNCDALFERIYEVPEQHQLFILAVIFWMNRAPRADACFLTATLLSLLALNIVDKKCENIFRNQHVFMKKYKKYLDDQKASLKEVQESETSAILEAPKVSQILRSIPKEISKSEALLAVESFVGHYAISPKMERKHADFKREVVHTFAELQAIIFNLNALNPILNFPFENVKIGNYFNGLFLYNIYNSLRIRADPLKYVQTNVLNNSPNLLKYFTTFLNFCLELLPNVKLDHVTNVESQKKSKKAKINRIKKPTTQPVSNDCLDQNKDESEEEFNDLNNKFNVLLNIK